MMIFELKADDRTVERLTARTRWRFLFTDLQSAKHYAEADYRDLTGEALTWNTDGGTSHRLDGLVARSPEAGPTQYYIHVREVMH